MNLLIHAASETDSNLFYATGFRAGDPFTYFRTARGSFLVTNELEYGRARHESRVRNVLVLSDAARRLAAAGRPAAPPDVLAHVLRTHGVRRALVPSTFPLLLAQQLSKRGIRLSVRPEPFFPARLVKRADELRAIRAAIRVTEEGIGLAKEMLRASRIRGNRLLWRGRPLTAEIVRTRMHVHFLERGCIAKETIVACGDQACDPHDRGSGLLRPHRAIVFDVFPRSATTLYWADVSRTFVKGRPSEALRGLYEAVRDAQAYGMSRIHAGVDGTAVHADVARFLSLRGYKTEKRGDRYVGFFHGTGHGLGLDIHEAPGIGSRGSRLPEGTVVTVEPGLYYPGIGGVRIEDDVVVTRSGCRSLSRFPKDLVIR